MEIPAQRALAICPGLSTLNSPVSSCLGTSRCLQTSSEPSAVPTAMATETTCSAWPELFCSLRFDKCSSHKFPLKPLLLPAFAIALWAGEVASAAEPPKRNGPTMAEVLVASKPADWRPLDPENTLYVEFAPGRVVIELAPTFAPRHVANVKALAREHYYDGLAIIRVQDNYVVQWADPNADKPERARKIQYAQRNLPAEFDRPLDKKIPFTRLPDGDVYAPEVGFSGGFPVARDKRTGKMWLIHTYGMVGAGRDNAPDSGGGTELYVVIGHAPRQLDRNVTLLGRVVRGMELLSALPRGTGPMGFYEKPEQNVPIKSIRVASDGRSPSAALSKSCARTPELSRILSNRAGIGAKSGSGSKRVASKLATCLCLCG